MRSCLKLAFTGFILGATLFFGVLFFPRNWIHVNDDRGLAGLLFLVGMLAGMVSLFTLISTFS